MAWTFKQRTPGGTFGSDVAANSGTTSLNTGAFGSAVTLNDIVLVFAWGNVGSSPTLSCSDNGSTGNAYTKIFSQYFSSSGDWLAVFGATITNNPSSGNLNPKVASSVSTAMCCCAAEFSGGSLTLDGSAVTASGTTGSPAPGSLTTTVANDLVIAMFTDGANATVTITTPTSFTEVGCEEHGTSQQIGEACYEIASGTGTFSPSFGDTSVSGWAAVVLALQPASVSFDPSTNPSWMGQVPDRVRGPSQARPWLAADAGPAFWLNDPGKAVPGLLAFDVAPQVPPRHRRAYGPDFADPTPVWFLVPSLTPPLMPPEVPVPPRRNQAGHHADPTAAYFLNDPFHAVPGLLAFDVAPQVPPKYRRAYGPDFADPTFAALLAAPALTLGPDLVAPQVPARWPHSLAGHHADAGPAWWLTPPPLPPADVARPRRAYGPDFADATPAWWLTPPPVPVQVPVPPRRAGGPDRAEPTAAFWLTDPFRAPVLGSVEAAPLPSRPWPRVPPQIAGETLGIAAWTAPPPVVVRPPGAPAVQAIAAPAFPLIADEDTVEAFQAAWETAMSLPALFPLAPGYGRLKSPQPPLYAQVGSEFLRREKSGTGGAWFDTRKVTIIVRGNKADVVAAAAQVLAVFNEQTTLVYPSGARFFKWWPGEEIRLAQDPDTKAGYDVWTATLTAEVTSIRSL